MWGDLEGFFPAVAALQKRSAHEIPQIIVWHAESDRNPNTADISLPDCTCCRRLGGVVTTGLANPLRRRCRCRSGRGAGYVGGGWRPTASTQPPPRRGCRWLAGGRVAAGRQSGLSPPRDLRTMFRSTWLLTFKTHRCFVTCCTDIVRKRR